jgi:bifunctional non-homologous end joining protein LigD
MPCGDRRKRLEREFTDLHDTLQLSPILSGQAHHVLTHVKDFEFEGVIAKRLDSIYVPGKTSDMWQKLKTQKSEDYLVGGYIPGRYGVEQLVVGEKRDAHFYFIDSVKNGFVRGHVNGYSRFFRAKKPRGARLQTCRRRKALTKWIGRK